MSENGVASYAKADGKLAWATPFGGITDWFFKGNNFFVQNDKSNVVGGVDLATGKFKGQVAFGKNMHDMTNDGEFIYLFQGKLATKYTVN